MTDLTQQAKLNYLASHEQGFLLDRYGHELNLKRAQTSTSLSAGAAAQIEAEAQAAIAQIDEMLALVATERMSIETAAPAAIPPPEPDVQVAPAPSTVDPGS